MVNAPDWIKQDKKLLSSFTRCHSQPRCIQYTLGHLAIMDMSLLQTESTSFPGWNYKKMYGNNLSFKGSAIVEFETLDFFWSWSNIFIVLLLLHKTTWTFLDSCQIGCRMTFRMTVQKVSPMKRFNCKYRQAHYILGQPCYKRISISCPMEITLIHE